MISRFEIAPPNSVVFVEDKSGKTAPLRNTRAIPHIVGNSTQIMIACESFMDGKTNFILGPNAEVDPGEPITFESFLETPSREVAVRTCELTTLLLAAVPADRTRIRIWTNHPTEPDHVIIGLGD